MRSFEQQQKSNNASSLTIHPQLEVGGKDDPQEKEANAMADKVMRMSDGDTVRPKMGDEEEGKVRKMGDEEEGKVMKMGDDEEKKVMKMGDEEDGKVMKMDAGGGGGMAAPANVASGIQSTKGGGQNLPQNVQQDLGGKMGADFSDVKVHTDDHANEMSESISAKAFTHGKDIYFRQGNYSPESGDGKKLLAHELTHTMQSGGAIRRAGNKGDWKGATDAYVKWDRAYDRLIDGVSTVSHANMVKFLTATSDNPSIALSKNYLRDISAKIYSKILGGVIDHVGQRFVKKTTKWAILGVATAIGAEGGPWGLLIGFIIGLIIDFIVDAVWELIWPNKEAEEAVVNTNKNLRPLLLNEILKGYKVREASRKERQKCYNDFFHVPDTEANANKAKAYFEGETKDLQTMLPVKYSDDLYLELLRNWTLEHAGEYNNADKYVNSLQWENAIKELKKNKMISADPESGNLGNIPMLFAYQFRADLGRFGLKPDAAQKVLYNVKDTLRKNPNASDPAAAILGLYDDNENRKHGYRFTGADLEDPEKFIEQVNATSDWAELTSEAKRLIRSKKGFVFSVYLDLESDSGTVQVDEFLYHITFTEDLEWYAFQNWSWYESID